MERNPDTNKSQRTFYSFGVSKLKVPMFPGKPGKGNYTLEDVYEKADSERDFRYKM
jgi:hypothetical protein